MRRPVVVALAVVGVAALAWLPWPTDVPNDLALPRIDENAVFGSALVEKAERYRRFLYADWALAHAALLAALLVYALRGPRLARRLSSRPLVTGTALAVLGLALVWVVQLPFAAAAHWWNRRYGLTTQGYVGWLVDDWAFVGAALLAGAAAAVLLIALARAVGERWWLAGGAVASVAAAVFTFATPYLYASEPLDRPALRAAAARYERALGIGDIPVRVDEVSDTTIRANALALGLGPSRRVLLWDTILRAPFDPAARRAVLAHELAHHSEQHLAKGIAWFALAAFPGAWIVMRATRRRGGLARPEAVPLALLVVALLVTVLTPVGNAISRRLEAEADWKALELTRDPAGFQRLMTGLSQTSLADPTPPRLLTSLAGSHPTLADRVAMAHAWAERQEPR